MTCPRCGYDEVPNGVCARCGIVAGKYRPAQSRPILTAAGATPSVPDAPAEAPAAAAPGPAPSTLSPQPAARSRAGTLWLALGLLAVAGLAWVVMRPPRLPASPDTPPPRATAADATAAAPPAGEAPQAALPILAPPAADGGAPLDAPRGLTPDELRQARDIAARVPDRVWEADERRAEALLARLPDDPQLRNLLAGVSLALAQRDLDTRRFPAAQARFERAAGLVPHDARPHVGLHNVFATLQDWARAESAIRAALELDPHNVQAQRALAYALFRQDKNREARETLRTLLASADDAEARALLERIDATQTDERGMTEQRLAHFHVRYDGDAHEDVGRAILRALERHYATLAITLDHRPGTVVPVILFSRDAYYAASGAPSWSGGQYDRMDGRIRIPIGGLTSALTPDIDDTLIHELTHAFVHDRARGHAPRELNEGLAQYYEGKRIDRMLDDERKAALAAGRVRGVMGFYLEGLAFTEYLMAQRGQGGINDVLRVMGETGSVDRAFVDVYGRHYREVREAFRQRFRRQAGV